MASEMVVRATMVGELETGLVLELAFVLVAVVKGLSEDLGIPYLFVAVLVRSDHNQETQAIFDVETASGTLLESLELLICLFRGREVVVF